MLSFVAHMNQPISNRILNLHPIHIQKKSFIRWLISHLFPIRKHIFLHLQFSMIQIIQILCRRKKKINQQSLFVYFVFYIFCEEIQQTLSLWTLITFDIFVLSKRLFCLQKILLYRLAVRCEHFSPSKSTETIEAMANVFIFPLAWRCRQWKLRCSHMKNTR